MPLTSSVVGFHPTLTSGAVMVLVVGARLLVTVAVKVWFTLATPSFAVTVIVDDPAAFPVTFTIAPDTLTVACATALEVAV